MCGKLGRARPIIALPNEITTYIRTKGNKNKGTFNRPFCC